jgi:uncharacterized membrane protein
MTIISKIKGLLFILLVLVGSSSSAIEITELSADSLRSKSESAVVLNKQNSGKRIYLDKTDAVLYDFSEWDFDDRDSVDMIIGGVAFVGSPSAIYLVSDLSSGHFSVEVKDTVKDKFGDLKNLEESDFKLIARTPLIKKDTIVAGLLMLCLTFVFFTSGSKKSGWKKFYKYIPALLMCYLLPAVLNSLGIISSESSDTYKFAKNYLLPASLVLMTISIDFKAITNLGIKSIWMFLTGTIGVIIGGPIAILIMSYISPETVGGAGPDAVWRGLSTLAGSWIGGGANQAAMLEVFHYNPQKYGGMVLVDIVVANIWMAILLLGVGKAAKIDKWFKADSSAIEELKEKVENYSKSVAKIPSLNDLMIILGIGISVTAVGHFLSGVFTGFFKQYSWSHDTVLANGFFWLVVLATTIGLILSFTKVRRYEGAGASKMGSVFIYVLVATIGMKMDLVQILDNPLLIVVGLIWMVIHVGLLVIVAKIIRAPFFFLAVGSKANIGGAASAPVVAAAFHPALAPVGVLLAVLGYALGTYGALLCATLMEIASKV